MNNALISKSHQDNEDTCRDLKPNRILDAGKVLNENKQETQNESSKNLQNKFDLPSFKCEACPYESIWKHAVKRHQQTHYKGDSIQEGSKKQKYQCETCSYSANNWAILKDHQKLHMIPKTKIKLLNNLNQTKGTANKEEENKYICKNCKYNTTNKLVFKNHMKVHLPKTKVDGFQCDQCTFQSVYRQSFLRHIKAFHEINVDDKKHDHINDLHCNYCGITYDNEFHFDEHMIIHEEQKNIDEQSAYNTTEIKPLVKVKCNSINVQRQNNNLKGENSAEIQSSGITNTVEPTSSIVIEKPAKRTRRGKYSNVPVKTTKNGLFQCEHCSYQTAIRTALVKHQTNHLKNSNS